MQAFAQLAGTFVGYMIGSVLKIAGPELKSFLVEVARAIFKDSAEVGSPNARLNDVWANGVRNTSYTATERPDGDSPKARIGFSRVP